MVSREPRAAAAAGSVHGSGGGGACCLRLLGGARPQRLTLSYCPVSPLPSVCRVLASTSVNLTPSCGQTHVGGAAAGRERGGAAVARRERRPARQSSGPSQHPLQRTWNSGYTSVLMSIARSYSNTSLLQMYLDTADHGHRMGLHAAVGARSPTGAGGSPPGRATPDHASQRTSIKLGSVCVFLHRLEDIFEYDAVRHGSPTVQLQPMCCEVAGPR